MKVKVQWCSLVSFCLAVFQVQAATVPVNISGFAFAPTPQTVSVGDTVEWTNQDGFVHTVTAQDSSFDSGTLGQGGKFSRTFSTAGTIDYFCGFHPGMIGQIIVQGAQAVPPTVTITSPANNATIAAPGSVLIEATASANGAGNSIASVEFFDNGASIGTDTSSPFSVTANLNSGPHALTAKATDSNAASTTSTAVNVTVGSATGTELPNPIEARVPKGNLTIELQSVATGLVSPLGMAAPDDGSKRLFVFDQVGLVYVITNGARMTDPLLDVRSRLVALSANYDERGLLGLATHPNFAQNSLVYTYTSEPNAGTADFPIASGHDHQSVIAEWRIDAANTNRIDPASRREIMRIDKPQSNHNGGALQFGPDGFLYIAIGDGGAGDDQGPGHTTPGGNGQDKSKILGKLARIDVNARTSANGQYGVPTDNPFVSESGTLPEIYAVGLRNPYNFTFDKQNGELWLGDVGQNDIEEIDKVTKGANLGWPIKEGGFFFNMNGDGGGFVMDGPNGEVPTGLIDPVAQYDHDDGVAVIGGYVYRGEAIGALSGKYVTGDLGTGVGRLFYVDGTEVKQLRIGFNDRALGMWLKGYGQDQDGEIYILGSPVLGPSGTSGQVLKIVKPDPIVAKIPKGNITIDLQTVAEGMIAPLGLAAPDDGSRRLFVYDQAGLMYVVTNGVKMTEPLLDVRPRLVSLNQNYDERGLIGAAAHPNFAQNPLIYTYTSERNGAAADFPITYTDGTTNNHQSVIAEWRIDAANTNRVDPASRREILRIDKPQSNHNGGSMRFGPDGMLYVTIGDGGAADDQGPGHTTSGGNAQDLSKILGKIIRIDVNARTSPNGQYGIPTDNPFVGQAGQVAEIYAYGLRNPYSFTFDKQNGDLWLGDVGQNDIEEIDKVTKGANLGWPIKEGNFYFDMNGTNDGFATTLAPNPTPTGLTDAVAQYDHDEGAAVIGGYVYRGTNVAALSGKYVTGDWGKFSAAEGRLFYLDGTELKELKIGASDRSLGLWLKGYGEGPDGELYVFGSTDLGPTGTSGKMLKIVTPTFSISEVALDGENLLLRWSGGTPPYHIFKRTDLEASPWVDIQTVTTTNATVAIEPGSAFFKIQSQ